MVEGKSYLKINLEGLQVSLMKEYASLLDRIIA
jgi:hypothetical protein